MKKKLFSLLLLAVVCCTTSLFAQQSSIKVDPVGEVDKIPVVVKKVGKYFILSSQVGKKVNYIPVNLAKRYQKPATKLVISGVFGKVDKGAKSIGVPIKLTYSNLMTTTTRNNPNQPKTEPKVEVEVAKEGDVSKGDVAIKGNKSKTPATPQTKEEKPSGPTKGVLKGGNKKVSTKPVVKGSVTNKPKRGKTIQGEKGIVAKSGDIFIIKTKDGKQYAPSNLDLRYKKVGLKVILSGEVGKIPPNVRMVGTPLKITSIKPILGGRSKMKKRRKK